ncbi:MAG: glycosyltransferase [Bacteroidetes bacterium]|nr:glycosyltransferase [Bacteroidota bacterium]
MGIREIVVFTNGDSRRPGTWSNVPYFFTQTLEKKGIIVRRVNLNAPAVFRLIFKYFISVLIKIFEKATTYTVLRSGLHYSLAMWKIRFSNWLYPKADLILFLTATYDATPITKKKVVLFCDWTYEHDLEHFKRKKPDHWEQSALKRENRAIENAYSVFCLFPSISNKMVIRYQNPNIFYIGNVINCDLSVDSVELSKSKNDSNDILFVGKSNYLAGAKTLIEAFIRVKKIKPELRLHIIGLTENQIKMNASDVTYYGYLDKGNAKDSELYYSLFSKAAVFINTTPVWGSFSAMVEAMYFCTPMIVSPTVEFVATFGDPIPFGKYCNQNTPENVASLIVDFFDNSDRVTLSLNAHEATKSFTWSAYVDKFLNTLNYKLAGN